MSPGGATALSPLPPHQPVSLRGTLRRAALGAVAAAVLVTGAMVAVPDSDDAPPGPVARAEAAAAAGSPASLSDLTALIGDRQQWVRTHPSDAPSWAVLGSAYVEWGRRSADAAYYARAEKALRRSLAARPGERGNEAAWVGLASLAVARHDYLAAKKWGESVRTRQPSNWSAYPVLIDAYNGLGEYKAAATATQKFAKLRKGVPALVLTAQMYRNQGWREDALATAQEAADRAVTPTEKAATLRRLGDLAWERGEPGEAVAQYEAALRLDKGLLDARAGRARALVALDRTDEGLADYQAAIAKLPRPEYVLELGELYESLGLDGDARIQFRKLRAMLAQAKADGVNESVLLARYEADHGNPDAAVKVLRAEWDGMHRSAAVADALGWALHRAGRSEEAVEYAQRAEDTGVRDASYAYHLGMIQSALSREGSARRHLEEALRTNPAFSPLAAPLAKHALDSLGEPAPGGPEEMEAPAPDPAAAPPEPSAEPSADPAEPAPPAADPEASPAPDASADPDAPSDPAASPAPDALPAARAAATPTAFGSPT